MQNRKYWLFLAAILGAIDFAGMALGFLADSLTKAVAGKHRLGERLPEDNRKKLIE